MLIGLVLGLRRRSRGGTTTTRTTRTSTATRGGVCGRRVGVGGWRRHVSHVAPHERMRRLRELECLLRGKSAHLGPREVAMGLEDGDQLGAVVGVRADEGAEGGEGRGNRHEDRLDRQV